LRAASFAFVILIGAMHIPLVPAGELIVPSEAVVRGEIRAGPAQVDKCLSAPATEILAGAHLEIRRCRHSGDQIFDWNVLSFELKVHKLCVDALRAGGGRSQPGDPVGLWYCQGTQHQRWLPFRTVAHAPVMRIVGGHNQNGSLCLTVLDPVDASEPRLTIANCDGSASQLFWIRPWPPLSGGITSRSVDREIFTDATP
jgi:Ricin-type beta-trefoil lectin domain